MLILELNLSLGRITDAGVRLPEVKDAEAEPLESRYPKLPEAVISLAKVIVPFPAVW